MNPERKNAQLKSAEQIDYSRRRLLGAIGAAMIVPGCCCMRSFPVPRIEEKVLKAGNAELQFLAPTIVNKVLTKGLYCVDVHAHFFNASDVTVKGYLGGPVAHSVGGVQGRLIKLLAPLADELGAIAPPAWQENDYLDHLESRIKFKAAGQVEQELDDAIAQHRKEQSRRFYELLMTPKGRPFIEEYNKAQADARIKGLSVGTNESFNEQTLAKAMDLGEIPLGSARAQLQKMEKDSYADGIIAFVGYMLSYRWSNLCTYRKAFTAAENSIGVNRVLGSLVDFDRWLECAPRTAHEDQMRLHTRISKLSGGYMLPLISYNPWTDVVEKGKSLSLVVKAVKEYGFVGAKIYPANGFRPWGNTSAQGGIRLPSPSDINRALEAFWDKCIELDIPVMAHTGQSMGKDDAHDLLGGPEGWDALISAYAQKGKSPLVNLGHFGGDTDGPVNNWTMQMAATMGRPYADKMFGDLGYWSELRCHVVGQEHCGKAKDRLKSVLSGKLNGREHVADRVMFGSDWLMLSREPDWSNYAAELFASVKAIAPNDIANIFGRNAIRCFGARIKPA